MKVKDARIVGVLFGLISGITSFEYNELISFSLGSLGVVSFFLGKKIIKGQNGGLLEGFGIGLFIISASQQFNLFFGTNAS